MARKTTDSDVNAFIWQIKLLMIGFGLLLIVPLVVYVFVLDRRLDSFEDSLRYRPPAEDTSNDTPATEVVHAAVNPVSGQMVYVPAYSHIYHGDGDAYLLTITLSVRNTSIDKPIVVKSVRYFDTEGKQVKSYLAKPLRVPPLGTTEFLVERGDATGGSGANFLVEWNATEPVSEPIIEAVMIDTNSRQGISFARRGSVIGTVATGDDP